MDQQGITLEDLSAQTGVEARTLRSWVAEGLLSPPLKSGRGALYPESNYDRALAVRALKDHHGLSFSEIRKRFMMADERQIGAWAGEVPVPGKTSRIREYLRDIDRGTRRGDSEHRGKQPAKPSYEQGLFDGPAFSQKPSPEKMAPLDRNGASHSYSRASFMSGEAAAGLEALLAQLESAVDLPPTRRSRGRGRYHIPITPDLELSVRGELSPRERAILERIADLMRSILMGGTDAR